MNVCLMQTLLHQFICCSEIPYQRCEVLAVADVSCAMLRAGSTATVQLWGAELDNGHRTSL